ncbi:MAG: hypothetical protein IKE73_05055 [Bacilli bacterium]|nr:hypothetical protein [Bacilli bacterium]
MKKDLPNIYKGKVMNNQNQKEIILKEEEVSNIESSKEYKSVDRQIKDIFSSDAFIYKAETLITLNDGSKIKKTIIGKTNNSLITMDDELIDVNRIVQIELI